MDFDWITIHLDKIDTVPEWVTLILLLAGIGTVVWYITNKNNQEAINALDEKTITSYKSALESTRENLQTQLDHCSAQHKESQDQLNEQNKKIAGLMGEIKTLREIPLAEMANAIDSIVVTNGKILDQLKASAVTLVRDTEEAKTAVRTVNADLETV